jgi:hypothetical protein
LALVFALAGGDYLLWNWSLQGGHDVLALISGLTLTPLALALLWLLVLNTGRLLGWVTQRPRGEHSGASAQAHAPSRPLDGDGEFAAEARTSSDQGVAFANEDRGAERVASSSKLAA